MVYLMTAIALCFCLTGCANSAPDNLETLTGLQNLDVKNMPGQTPPGVSSIRQAALSESAMSVGAQSGLAWRAEQINHIVKNYATDLDHIFNFNLLLLERHILPPVLMEANDTMNIANDDTIRLADKTYKIVSQARFVTTAPTWREYIWLNYSKPEMPDKTMLPKDYIEVNFWKKEVSKGWNEGIHQADEIYQENLNRLRRDMTGMVLYRRLLANHMVSPPFVAETQLGVTGNDSEMNINDTILRITALPSLETNTDIWKPAITRE